VDSDDLVGFQQADLAGYMRAEVAAVGQVAVIAQTTHQLRPRGGDALDIPAGLVSRA